MALQLWLKDGYTVEVIPRLQAEAEEAIGTDLDVTVFDEVSAHDRFVEAARTGEGPDLVTTSFWYLPEYAAAGWLRPLSEVQPEIELDRYHPIVHEALSVDGQLLAVPHTLIGGMLCARADLLGEAGLDVPTTPSAIAETAATLATEDTAGLVARSRPEFPSYGTFSGWAWGKGVSLLDDDAADAAGSIADLIATLRAHGGEASHDLDYIEAGRRMFSGGAALAFDTTGWGNYLEDPARSSVVGRVAYAVPRGDAAALQFPYSEGLAVTAWSSRVDEAARLLAWRHHPDTLVRECLEQGRFDFPRIDLRSWERVAAAAGERGLDEYLRTLAEAWDAIELASFPLRADFVEIGRRIMAPISAAIAGEQVDLAAALAAARR